VGGKPIRVGDGDTTLGTLVLAGESSLKIRDLLDEKVTGAPELFSDFGQPQATRRTFEERQAKLLLERADTARESGVVEARVGRRESKGARVRYGREPLEVVPVEHPIILSDGGAFLHRRGANHGIDRAFLVTHIE